MIIAMTNQELISLLEEKFKSSINSLIITEKTGKSVTIDKKEIKLDNLWKIEVEQKTKPLERF